MGILILLTPAGAPPMLLFMLNFRACAILSPRKGELPMLRLLVHAVPVRPIPVASDPLSYSCSVVRPQDTLSTSFHTYLLACLPPCLSFLLVLSLARSPNVKDGHGCGCDRNRAREWGESRNEVTRRTVGSLLLPCVPKHAALTLARIKKMGKALPGLSVQERGLPSPKWIITS